MSSCQVAHLEQQTSGRQLSRRTKQPQNPDGTITAVYLTIFVFRGHPVDTYSNRHCLLYFTSAENREFHETIHVQRQVHNGPWHVDRLTGKVDWVSMAEYLAHINAGTAQVRRGEESALVDIFAAVPVDGNEDDWNCQHFLLNGMQELVSRGHQTQEWYEAVEDELTSQLVNGAVG